MTARPKPKLIYARPTEHIYGSREFIERTRRPSLESPKRFEPTVKADGDVVI